MFKVTKINLETSEVSVLDSTDGVSESVSFNQLVEFIESKTIECEGINILSSDSSHCTCSVTVDGDTMKVDFDKQTNTLSTVEEADTDADSGEIADTETATGVSSEKVSDDSTESDASESTVSAESDVMTAFASADVDTSTGLFIGLSTTLEEHRKAIIADIESRGFRVINANDETSSEDSSCEDEVPPESMIIDDGDTDGDTTDSDNGESTDEGGVKIYAGGRKTPEHYLDDGIADFLGESPVDSVVIVDPDPSIVHIESDKSSDDKKGKKDSKSKKAKSSKKSAKTTETSPTADKQDNNKTTEKSAEGISAEDTPTEDAVTLADKLSVLSSVLNLEFISNGNSNPSLTLRAASGDFTYFVGDEITVEINGEYANNLDVKNSILGFLSDIPFTNKEGQAVKLIDVCWGTERNIDVYPPFSSELGASESVSRIIVHGVK